MTIFLCVSGNRLRPNSLLISQLRSYCLLCTHKAEYLYALFCKNMIQEAWRPRWLSCNLSILGKLKNLTFNFVSKQSKQLKVSLFIPSVIVICFWIYVLEGTLWAQYVHSTIINQQIIVIVKVFIYFSWFYKMGLWCWFEMFGLGFPGGAVIKNLPANAGDRGLSPDLGRSHMPRSN